jgi:hypothetical protein
MIVGPKYDGKLLVCPGYDGKLLAGPEYDGKRLIVTGTTVKGLQRSDAGGVTVW